MEYLESNYDWKFYTKYSMKAQEEFKQESCKDYPDWNAGWGTCDTYAIDGRNRNNCWVDAVDGIYAFNVCAECGYCVDTEPSEEETSNDEPECVNINLHFSQGGLDKSWSIHETDGSATCFGSGYHNSQWVPEVNDCCLTHGQKISLRCYSGHWANGWDGAYIEINGIRYCEAIDFSWYDDWTAPGYGYVKTYDFIVGQEEPREFDWNKYFMLWYG